MNSAWMQMAAGRGALGIGLVVAGVVVVVLLLGAFVLGVRVKRREPPTPRPDEQPRVPDGGPVRETSERREPDEVPRSQERLTPHELKRQGDRTSTSQERPRWNEGSSGSFGGGGPGGH